MSDPRPSCAARRFPRLRIGLPLLALLLTAPAARAQSARPVKLMLGGGVAFPNGSPNYGFDTGYQVQGALELSHAPGIAALRVEALYNRFGFGWVNPAANCFGPCPPQPAHESTLAGTLNLVLAPHARGLDLAPYLVGGAGFYDRHDDTADFAWSHTDFGLNGGIGLRIPALHAFLEAREHFVKNAPNYLPITAGIRF